MMAAMVMLVAHQNAPWKAPVAPWLRSDCRATATIAVPNDLVRYDLLMDLKPVEPARIRSIIDELFLPLVHSHQRQQKEANDDAADHG
jgi:hypothetical protein